MSDYIWEYEAMQEDKERREAKRLKREKEKQARLKEKRKIQKRRNRIFKFVIFMLILLIIAIVPVIKVNSVEIVGELNLSKTSVMKELNYKKKESLFTIFYKKLKYAYKNDVIESISIAYDVRYAKLTAEIHEALPLSHDNKGNKYISNKGKIIKSNQAIITPLININKQDKVDEINEQLTEVPYDVIIQIKEINYSSEKDDILLIDMRDGNKIYIYPNQIGRKVKHYRQMKEILDAKGKGPGNIYLYMGDYYEER